MRRPRRAPEPDVRAHAPRPAHFRGVHARRARTVDRAAHGRQPARRAGLGRVISGSFSPGHADGRRRRFNLLATGKELPKNPSRIIDPPDGRVPYQPWAAERAGGGAAEGHRSPPTRPWHIDTQNRCLPHGVTRGFYTTSARVQQFPGVVALFFQHA